MKRAIIAALLPLLVTTGVYNETSFDPLQHGPDYEQLTKAQRRQVDCLAMNVYREAGYEKFPGQLAVAMVTMNRVKSGMFKDSVCRVTRQSKNGVCQFSWTCVKTGLTKVNPTVYNYVRGLSTKVYVNHESIEDHTRGALFFHTKDVTPRLKNVAMTARIGRHLFYKPIGA